MAKKEVTLTEVELNEALQMRAVDPPPEEYEELLRKDRGEWPFPPLEIIQVEERLLLVSGFTRYRAAVAAGRKKAPANVVRGTWMDAVSLACGENAEHGFRRTAADKRRAIMRAIEEGITGPTVLARTCKVARATVYTVMAELESAKERKPKKAATVAKSTPASKAPSKAEITDECPVCGGTDWDVLDSGYECSACKHVHGEVGASDGDAEDVKWEVDRTQSLDSGVKKDLATAVADFGRLVRSLKNAGLEEETRSAMERINRVLQRASGKSR